MKTAALAPLALARVPAGRTFTWPVPGSKSITNRAFVLAALAEGPTTLENVLESDDTRYMRAGLVAMGARITDGVRAGDVIIEAGLSRLAAPAEPVFVGNSGTTVRFLAALAALLPGRTVLVGDEHMARRPIGDMVAGLAQLGVTVECSTGCPPLTVHGGGFSGGHIRMRGDKSSQYFTALLLAGGLARRGLSIELEGTLVSRPYVEMTAQMVRDFGGLVEGDERGFRAHPVAGYRRARYRIEPDASAASYPFALAAAGGHEITVLGLSKRSLQGDFGFVDVLERAGARVVRNQDGTTVIGGNGIAGVDVDMHDISDTAMTLAAIAPLAGGATTIRNVANIRIKETDRLLATVTELRRLGQTVVHGDDWLSITPRPLTPATVECYSDHRMAMSFAVLGAVAGGVTIGDPACVSKTYPGFWADLAALSRTG
jgi:3-phosphoshikimate 1-carboxyvinyltransferase